MNMPANTTETFVAEQGVALWKRLASWLGKVGYREPIVIAMPAAVGADVRKKLLRTLGGRGAAGVTVVEHDRPETAPTSEPPDVPRLHMMFVDQDATLRTVERFSLQDREMPKRTRRWARVYAAEARAGDGR